MIKKILFVLLACCILAVPAMAQTTATDELSSLSNQQLLAVFDALVDEFQRRGVDTTAQTPRDSNIVLGQNIHVTDNLTTCLPTAVPDTSAVQLPIVPTATPIAQTGDKASYESQTPADGVHVSKGQAFDITWYLLNTGTTTWTTDYCIRYFSSPTRTNFTKPGKDRYYLNEAVPPNAVGACSIDAVAPTTAGTYSMTVVLGNENEENFYYMDITIVVD